MKRIDLIEQKFGRLKVTKMMRDKVKQRTNAVCTCDCGKETVVFAANLTRDLTKSCGCSRKELTRKRVTTHGFSRNRFYIIYHSMVARCNLLTNSSYDRYGARGIKCLWKNFEEFHNDMHESYLDHIKEFGKKNTTIDRIDNNGNYCKENCRWASWKEQQRNRSDNRLISFRGETLCLSQWAEKLGISTLSLFRRLENQPIDKALTTVVR